VPRVAQRSIEAIKHQVNLVDVVSPYVQLKRSGRSWKGLSPFTTEKTPSFYVHPDRGFFKCFSTGEGGDCFSFVMKVENLEFIEAVEFIAKRFNINLEYEEGGPSREEISLRKQIFDLHEIACDWFHRQLVESSEAAPVRTYWKEERGFTGDTAKEYKIGYAPASQNALALHCKERGVSTAAMQQSGLFFAREREEDYSRFKSRFRGRLMIPIRDVQSRVVAFTARKLDQTPADDPASEAKYVNSPETAIFHKSRILFGLDHARTHLKDGDSFLLVEGQLDAIRCWTVGIHTAVAPQGTAITEEQLALLSRYDPSGVEYLLDGDSAGRKAAIRTLPLAIQTALPLAFQKGIEFRFLMLPEKVDPDELFRKEGAAGLDALRKNSKSAIELIVEDKLPKDRDVEQRDKISALRSVYELVSRIEADYEKEEYIVQAANHLHIPRDLAITDYNKFSRSTRRSATSKQALDSTRDALLTQATWELLWLVLHHPEYSIPASETIDYEWIKLDSSAGRLLSRLLAEIREGLIEDSNQIETLIDTDEDRQLLADIHSRDLGVEEPKEHIEFCLNRLFRKHHEAQIKELENRIINAADQERLGLMKARKQLLNDLAKPLELQL
jgi:DNA primase